MIDLPILLYDNNKKLINYKHITKTNCFYFYSYKNITVEIVSGTGVLYSVKNISNNLVTTSGQLLTNNFGYTLYIPTNKTEILLKISDNTSEILYNIVLELDNIIDETNEHYNDLLVNNFLPNFEQLSKAIPNEFNKSELIKRLLLDFKNIIKHKGTKKSIETFLEFLGFNDNNLTIFSEYYNRQKDILTTNPNKETDVKTGNYYVLYDNFVSEGLDSNNLPIRFTNIDNVVSFQETLLNAIALANVYFTIDEQLITFFALNYSSNMPFEESITSNASMIFETDVLNFRKNLSINIKNYTSSDFYQYNVLNCLQKKDVLLKSEVKTYLENPLTKLNDSVYFVDDEIFDDEVFNYNDIDKYDRIFGNVLHLNIHSPNTYIKFEIFDKNYVTNKLVFQKSLITNDLNKIIVLKATTIYRLNIEITDYHNNTEKYFYDFYVNHNINKIDFDSFSSSLILDENKFKNDIILDIDSPTKLTTHDNLSKNYILPKNLIPLDLQNYYGLNSASITEWLTENNKFDISSIDKNYTVNEITESVCLNLFDNWLDIVCLKYDDNFDLKIKVYDINICEYVNIDYINIGQYSPISDKLYVMLIDIYDRDINEDIEDIKTPYYFITTTETGIDINKESYDFILINKITGEEISIYDEYIDNNLYISRIPVNYDFPLFEISSELYPNFLKYISPNTYKENIEGIDYTIIKSVFNRLSKISDNPDFAYNLKIGDFVFCKLNNNYVINEKNVIWKIFNTFTNELLFETSDFMLKYRIEDNIIYDVSCDFTIDNIKYNIMKKSVFSSFIKKYL